MRIKSFFLNDIHTIFEYSRLLHSQVGSAASVGEMHINFWIPIAMDFPLCLTARRQFLCFKAINSCPIFFFCRLSCCDPRSGSWLLAVFCFGFTAAFCAVWDILSAQGKKNTWPSQQQHPRGASWPLISRSTCSALSHRESRPTARPLARPAANSSQTLNHEFSRRPEPKKAHTLAWRKNTILGTAAATTPQICSFLFTPQQRRTRALTCELACGPKKRFFYIK